MNNQFIKLEVNLLNYFKHRITNAAEEGINNKIEDKAGLCIPRYGMLQIETISLP